MIRPLRFLGLLGVLLALFHPGAAAAQNPPPPPADDEPMDDPPPPRPPPRAQTTAPSGTSGTSGPADFPGALQTLRAPAGAAGAAGASHGPEIFPDSSRVWMSVRDADPLPIEAARRGGTWLCSNGQCTAQNGDAGQSNIGDEMLRSIKLQTPTLPLPLTIWGRLDEHHQRVLDFDPVLLGRRSYAHICSYKPIEAVDPKAPPKTEKEKVPICHDGPAALPSPDAGELTLGLEWPRQSELADFRYLAIVDSCGNARVQPFQRTFTVPVFEVASGGCGQPDGKVLRVFPQGGWIRVTAFNLDAPAAANVVNATYRVSVPPLENVVESSPARLLFPDPLLEDLKVDCGPTIRRAPADASGIPAAPPGAFEVPPLGPPAAPPGAAPPSAPPPDAGKAGGDEKSLVGGKISVSVGASAGKGAPPSKPPAAPPGKSSPPPPKPGGPPPLAPKGPPRMTVDISPVGPGPQPLAHESLTIAPEPLRQGNCRVRLLGQTKRRLVAPLALHVSFTRTDRTLNGVPIELLPNGRWIVTPNAAEFQLPPLAENFDGDSRLRLVVYSDPMSANGKVVLLSDAGRVATSLRSTSEAGEAERARRLIGSVVIHSVPICGASNFETVESTGNCLRAYITIPAMLATLQITRAPWLEKPLITRNVLSAVGVALAIDSYNPVERRAFPIAAQVGGFIESLGEGKIGMLGYVGVAPTLPILGTGGNTTSFGFLGGIGVEYITNQVGPDEGLKPAAFLGIVVQVGQANPAISGSAQGGFGSSVGTP